MTTDKPKKLRTVRVPKAVAIPHMSCALFEGRGKPEQMCAECRAELIRRLHGKECDLSCEHPIAGPVEDPRPASSPGGTKE